MSNEEDSEVWRSVGVVKGNYVLQQKGDEHRLKHVSELTDDWEEKVALSMNRLSEIT